MVFRPEGVINSIVTRVHNSFDARIHAHTGNECVQVEGFVRPSY